MGQNTVQDELLAIHELLAQHDWANAAQQLRMLLVSQPQHPLLLRLLGTTERQLGHTNLSIELLKHSLQADRGVAETWFELGCSLYRSERIEEAITAFKQAHQLRPNWADPLINIGSQLDRLEQYPAALNWLQQAAKISPGDELIHFNLGNTLQNLLRVDEAEQAFRRAIEIRPDFATAHWNLALCLLLQGYFAQGWDEYQWRSTAQAVALDNYPQPRLERLEKLHNQTVLVHAEQGIGDEIMFSSCLTDLCATGARVILICEPRLQKLFARSFPQVQVIGAVRRKDRRPVPVAEPVNRQLAIGDLPRFFRRKMADFPQRERYLHTDRHQVEQWRARLAMLPPGQRIGISWRAGGAPTERARRTTVLTDWLPLLQTPGVQWINLQYGETDRERNELLQQHGITIHDWPVGDPLVDLDQFAAQMQALDGVISVGNTTVHMAGALGVPAWVILPRLPAWRWMLNNDQIPWYHHVHCIRQQSGEQWAVVLQRVSKLWNQLGRVCAIPSALRTSPHSNEQTVPDQSFSFSPRNIAVLNTFDVNQALEQVRTYIQQQQWSAAERCCDDLLAHAPRNVQAWYALSQIARATKRWDLAIRTLERALSLAEKNPQLTQELAELLLNVGQFVAAQQQFQNLVLSNPELSDGWLGLGLSRRATNDFDGAMDALRRAEKLTPSNPKVHNFLGGVLIEQRAISEAIAAFRRAIELAPNYTAAWNNLGCVLHQQQDHTAAAECFAKILQLEPHNEDAARAMAECLQHAEAHASSSTSLVPEQSRVKIKTPVIQELLERAATLFNQEDYNEAAKIAQQVLVHQSEHPVALRIVGVAQRRRSEHDAAIATLQRAIASEPQNFALHFELGVCYLEQYQHQLAYNCFLKCIEIKPDFQPAYVNLSGIMEQQERYEDATYWARRAVDVAPTCALAHYNLGNSLREQGQIPYAIESYAAALQHDPNYTRAMWNLGICNLHLGVYAQGWPRYEVRGEVGEVDFDLYTQPRWQGESLAGKTILVHGEQGLGDEIVFCSCLPDLIPLAKQVVIVCEPRLEKLFQRSFPTARVYGYFRRKDRQGCAVAETVDYQIPMGSLPLHFRRNREAFPRQASFLTPQNELVQEWRARFASLGTGLKVGISWRAGGKPLERRKRSIPADLWGPIFTAPGAQFINLQYGDASADADEVRDLFGVTLHDWEQGDPLIDIDSFAAKIAALDLVISVGNATVHMAGALGTPAWTLLPMIPSWRWMIRGDESPWYKHVRLFRQPVRKAWSPVLDSLGQMLQKLVVAPRSQWRELASKLPCPPIKADQPRREKPLAEHQWLDQTQFSALASMEQIPLTMDAARAALEAKELDRAEELLRSILQIAPKFPSALHQLGLVALAQGRPDLAIRSLQRALSTAEAVPLRRCDLALAYRAANRMDEAISCYRRAIELSPTYNRAHAELADLLQHLGRAQEAQPHLLAAGLATAKSTQQTIAPAVTVTRQEPKAEASPPMLPLAMPLALPLERKQSPGAIKPLLDLPAHITWANPSQGQPHPVLDLTPTAKPITPVAPVTKPTTPPQTTHSAPVHESAEAKLLPIQELLLNSQVDAALRELQQLIAQQPTLMSARLLLAEVQLDEQLLDQAGEQLEIALAAQPTARGYSLRSRWHELAGRAAAALADLRVLLDIEPENTVAMKRAGTLAMQLNDPQQAESCFRRAVALLPNERELHNSLGLAIAEQGRLLEATSHYRTALSISGTRPYPVAHANLALALLQLGDYAAGWNEYEWRWQCPNSMPARTQWSIPTWTGSSLAGQHLLIHAEQGLGDELMFASCYKQVIAQAAQTTILCDPRLQQLWQQAFPGAKIIAVTRGQEHNWRPSPQQRIDVQIAAGSLPRHLRQARTDFNPGAAYLRPADQLLNAWRQRFSQLPAGVRIGLAWQGGELPKDRQNRCLELQQLTDLLQVPGVQWINLQHGSVASELQAVREQHGIMIHDWAEVDLRNDLNQLAACVAACDLVISVGNAIVHLAGALGVETWGLLPAASGWRWGPAEQPTPWYASVSIHRQSEPGDWAQLLWQLPGKLRQWLAQNANRVATAQALHMVAARQGGQAPATETAPAAINESNATAETTSRKVPIAAPHFSYAAWPATHVGR